MGKETMDLLNCDLKHMPFLDTPDFKYIFEDTVKLPEFELYHVGLGLYRFKEPVVCDRECLNRLGKKYPSLVFLYRGDMGIQVSLLFVMSKKYNIAYFQIFQRALQNKEFAAIIPRGYDVVLDAAMDGKKVSHMMIDGHCSRDEITCDDRLLGFQWEPEKYYDSEGRKLYILLQGHVGKMIMDNLYVFQGKRYYDLYYEAEQYPRFSSCNTIYSKKYKKCAVLGKIVNDVGITLLRVDVRYIAFDDAGLALLKDLYQYTVGYRYEELKVVNGNEDSEKEDKLFISDKTGYDIEELNRKEEKMKASYKVDVNAKELTEGIGYRDIKVYYRILYQKDDRELKSPKKYDYAYFLRDDTIRFVDFILTDMKIYDIPTNIFAELYVIKRIKLCEGIYEDILIEVINHKDLETSTLKDCADNFFEFTNETCW